MISELINEALKDLGLKASAMLSLASIACFGYLKLTVPTKDECIKKHRQSDDKYSEMEHNIKKEFQRLLDKFDSFKDKIIAETADNTARIDGIAGRMTSHYQTNTQQYLEILQEIKGLKKG